MKEEKRQRSVGELKELDDLNMELDLIKELGQGMFATVFKAFDKRLGRIVACKYLDKRRVELQESKLALYENGFCIYLNMKTFASSCDTLKMACTLCWCSSTVAGTLCMN